MSEVTIIPEVKEGEVYASFYIQDSKGDIVDVFGVLDAVVNYIDIGDVSIGVEYKDGKVIVTHRKRTCDGMAPVENTFTVNCDVNYEM